MMLDLWYCVVLLSSRNELKINQSNQFIHNTVGRFEVYAEVMWS